jgi:ATPase subunit of ABC transporter with duplicated ATPase domains
VGHGNRRRCTLIPSSPLLVVDAVVAGYAQPTVGPVSFTVGRGDVVGLAGVNGSGKTTLLNAIVGTAHVFSGRVTCDRAAGVSVLRQFPVRLPEMPFLGSEFLEMTGASHQEVPRHLRHLVDMRVDRLSGGQYQLLLVWACLGSASSLVLLDEPTNNMDPDAVDAVGRLLVESGTGGKGLLVVSHEPGLLERVCTRVVRVGR